MQDGFCVGFMVKWDAKKRFLSKKSQKFDILGPFWVKLRATIPAQISENWPKNTNFPESSQESNFELSNRFHWIQGHEKPRKQKKKHYFSSFLVDFWPLLVKNSQK